MFNKGSIINTAENTLGDVKQTLNQINVSEVIPTIATEISGVAPASSGVSPAETSVVVPADATTSGVAETNPKILM